MSDPYLLYLANKNMFKLICCGNYVTAINRIRVEFVAEINVENGVPVLYWLIKIALYNHVRYIFSKIDQPKVAY